MKKNKKPIIFWALIAIIFVLVSVGMVFLLLKIINNETLYIVTITDYLGIVLDILVGFFLAIFIYCFSNKQTNLNFRKEIAHESLNKLQSVINSLDRPALNCDLTRCWNSLLLYKKHISKYINSLCLLTSMNSGFISSCNLLRVHSTQYFEYYENHFFPKAVLNDDVLKKEQDLYDLMLCDIIDGLCQLY